MIFATSFNDFWDMTKLLFPDHWKAQFDDAEWTIPSTCYGPGPSLNNLYSLTPCFPQFTEVSILLYFAEKEVKAQKGSKSFKIYSQ